MTEPRPKFIILRPADRWDRTREMLDPLGIDMIFADVLTYIPTHTPLPPLTGIHALIITSQRAVTSLKEIPEGLKTLPLFVVGAETARVLRDLGFSGPQTVAPTGEALAPLIADHTPAHQHFLYLRGADVAVQFRKIIKKHVVIEHVSYRGLPKSGLPEDVLTAIRDERASGIMFFSRETTRAFSDMADRAGLIPNFSTLNALCLSPSVLGSLHPESFKRTIIAPTPDLVGMGQAVRTCMQPEAKDENVTDTSLRTIESDTDTTTNMIANADRVIERFGGIRPMANKLGVPVTTVQGWKKRGVIPANRAALIEQAAATHGVETTGLIHIISGDVTTRITLPSKPKTSEPLVSETIETVPVIDEPRPSNIQSDDALSSDSVQDILNQIADAIHINPIDQTVPDLENPRDTSGSSSVADDVIPPESSTTPPPRTQPSNPPIIEQASPSSFFNRRKTDKIARATWLAIIMLATAVIVGLIAMGPGVTRLKQQDTQLKTLTADLDHLTQELATLRRENALLSGLVPRDLKDKMSAIQTRAKNIETAVSDLGTQTKALTAGVMGSGEGSIEGRLSSVETTLGDISKNFASEHLARFVVFIATLKESEDGAEKIGSLVQTLYGALPVDITPTEFGPSFLTAVKTNPELSAIFTNMTSDEQRQAALLLVLAHVQLSSNQDRVSMDQATQLLSLMMPNQTKILDDMALFSKDGVRSIAGLSSDFDVMTDNVTTSLIKDDQASWMTKLWVQLHDKMRIERNGVALTGTTPQRILDRAKRAVTVHDIAAAITILQSLSGESAVIAAPWVQDAEQTIQAQKTIDQLTKIISATISIDPASAAIISTLSPKSNIIDITKGMAESLEQRVQTTPLTVKRTMQNNDRQAQ